MSPATDDPSEKLSRPGLFFTFGAYGLWGLFPIYFSALRPAGPFEVVSYRFLFSLVFCALLIVLMRNIKPFFALLKQRKVMLTLGLAAVLIYLNWQVFIIAILNNQIVETSLGYFINPILTVLLGVTVLKEKLRKLQWLAVIVSGIAVIVLTFSYGSIPWVALILAATFGLYGLIKKRMGKSVDAISGLTIETMWMTPVAIIQLIIVSNLVGLTFFGYGIDHSILLASAGVITAVPLLLFSAGARRLPLTAIGLIQYSTPITSFLMGVFLFNEPMPESRWIGFIIIWIALVILTVDMLRHGNARRLARAADSYEIK